MKCSTSAVYNPQSCIHCTKLWLCARSKSSLVLHQILTDNMRHHQLTGADSFSSFIAPYRLVHQALVVPRLKTSPNHTTRHLHKSGPPTPLCTILTIVYQIYNTSLMPVDPCVHDCPTKSHDQCTQ